MGYYAQRMNGGAPLSNPDLTTSVQPKPPTNPVNWSAPNQQTRYNQQPPKAVGSDDEKPPPPPALRILGCVAVITAAIICCGCLFYLGQISETIKPDESDDPCTLDKLQLIDSTWNCVEPKAECKQLFKDEPVTFVAAKATDKDEDKSKSDKQKKGKTDDKDDEVTSEDVDVDRRRMPENKDTDKDKESKGKNE